MKIQLLDNPWTVKINGMSACPVRVPGTLDESGIGFPDTGGNQWHPEITLGNDTDFKGETRILTRLTRKVTYEGPAWYETTFIPEDLSFAERASAEAGLSSGIGASTGDAPSEGEPRVFLEVERSRELTLTLNGHAVPAHTQGTVSTPHVFEVTPFLKPKDNKVVLCCDNSYPTWPHDAIVYSSAATDETQTNWNGLLGYVRLRYEARQFVSSARVYPTQAREATNPHDALVEDVSTARLQMTAEVVVEVDCAESYSGSIRLFSTTFARHLERTVTLSPGRHALRFDGVTLSPDAKLWDEGEGFLHDMMVEGDRIAPVTVRFGLRTFAVQNGRLALNGRPFFLRSEANCCVFPETGHMPMDVSSWKSILSTYAAYGVNCMRFHSHCPPDAAFEAADDMGMMMQPELSHWNPRTAFEDDGSWAYYPLEMRQILRAYANHPSFVMMTWGNELAAGELGHERMTAMLREAHALDATRLYAQGSNNHYGALGADPASDFYTGASVREDQMRATSAGMRGYLNEVYPSGTTRFDGVVQKLRGSDGSAVPGGNDGSLGASGAEGYPDAVFSFEVGQYEVLPDFDEWQTHTGITRPDNYDAIRERVTQAGWLPEWKRRVEATGELSLLAYREEVEAVLRSETLSGISLLGLQDFPGQGTALVGMLNAHLQAKPYAFAQPERFREFFQDVVPLLLMESYTCLSKSQLSTGVKLANYGKVPLTGRCVVRLTGGEGLWEQTLPEQTVSAGSLALLGQVQIAMPRVDRPCRMDVQVSFGTVTRSYPIWVYPDKDITVPEDVLLTASASDARRALAAGQKVLFTPPVTEETFPQSIRTQFTTDFWSVGTFASQEGFMGCLVDPGHPVFKGFPTEFHSNWQWWPMCQGRAMRLPEGVRPLVTALDCYARMRSLGMLVETRVGAGKLMVSSMGLLEHRQYPEVRAMLQSVMDYMASDAFQPEQEVAELAALLDETSLR